MPKKALKVLLLIALVAGVYAFFAYDFRQYLSFEYLKSEQAQLDWLYGQHQLAFILAYLGVYILTTALSLPGATILTLAGGALFGFWLGLALASIGSTVGATFAMLVARFLLRETVESRFTSQIAKVNDGIRREGLSYLLALRLIPVIPFFVVNLVMGLTAIPAVTFAIVSQIGMLIGTAVYVNAGTQLGQIESPRGIFSAGLVISFVLLGLLPVVMSKVLAGYRSRRLLRKYKKPKRFDYNLIAIGGGSAGLVSAYIAAAVKAKVVLIEKHKMGGDCLNTGCVPSKALIRSAKMLSYAARAKEFGFRRTEVEFDFAEVMERVQRVIGKIEPHDSVERYQSLGVECITGEARVRSPYEVEVNGRVLTTRNIVVATGARASVPLIPGLAEMEPLTSDNVWALRKRPERLVILGGGPIGSELAQAFQRLGSKVTIVEMSPRILGREDDDVADLIMNKFRKEGITLLTGHTAKRFSRDGGNKKLIVESGGHEVTIEFDQVLVALGRSANTKGFGLEELQVELAKNGTIVADEFLRTNYPNIYVCGDVTGPYQFTHVAAHQAWYCAVNALFSPFKAFKADYRVIPWATYTDPEVARVGLNEKEAVARNIPFEVTAYDVGDLDRAIADEEDHGMVKVLTPPGKDKILGVTIVGPHAADLLPEFVTAMKYGLGLNKILGTIHAYPSLAEMNKYVAGVWKKNHAPQKLLGFVERFHAWRRG